MVPSSASKRTCAARLSDLLGDAGILQQVLDFYGTRSYLYIGAVSSLWKQCYETVASAEEKRLSKSPAGRHRADGDDSPHKTSYGAALQSVATLTWAYTSGLQLRADNRSLQRAAGRRASLLLLAILHELGLVFDSHALDSAVATDHEAAVHYLHAEHHCTMGFFTGLAPAGAGNVRMLRCLRQMGYSFEHYILCSYAAQGGHLEALKYLRSEGCAWPLLHIAADAAGSGNLEMVSTMRCVQTMPTSESALFLLFPLQMSCYVPGTMGAATRGRGR
jgi:hypothetical protein